MRRIGRYIFNGLTALSLVLCVATLGLWVRSYWRADAIVRTAHNARERSSDDAFIVRKLWLYSVRGQIGVNARETAATGPEASKLASAADAIDLLRSGWHYQGKPSPGRMPDRWGFRFEWSHLTPQPAWDTRHVAVPCWLVVLVTALLPIRSTTRLLRKRTRPGHCSRCNYDLRATPDRCPECGTIPTKGEGVKGVAGRAGGRG